MIFGHAVTLPVPLIPSVALFAAIGALSSVLAHRGVSVFHDGLRPVMAAFRQGELTRREVSKTSFNLAWGFFWAFAIPFSVGYVIPLVYMIFMATDWIGVSVPGDRSSAWYRTRSAIRGTILALLAGGLWGAAMALVLRLVTEAMHRLPVEMATPVQLIEKPVAGAYFLFVVLTIAYHYGYRRAFVALVASSLAWFVALTAHLAHPPAWAFGVGTVLLLGFLIQHARRRNKADQTETVAWAIEDDDDDEEDFYSENGRRLRRALVPLVALAALMGAAYNWGLMTKDPIAGLLYAQGLAVPAALVMFAWAFAFIPMKFTTAAVTGCMATGTFLDQGVSMLMPNPWAAAAACAALRAVEVLALVAVVRGIERMPSIREVADVMRTAIFHVMEIGFLVGGALAASAFAGQWGFAIVIAAWFLNSRKNFPVMPMSIGAFTALAVGVFVNILAAVGLHVT